MRTLVILTLLELLPFAGAQRRGSDKVQPIPPSKVQPVETPVAALNRLQGDLVSAVNARDAVKVASLFAPDADFVPVIGPFAHGSAEIEAAWQRLFDLDAQDFSMTITAAAPGAGGTRYQIGYVGGIYEWTRVEGSTRKRERGRYLFGMLRVTDGNWDIRYAMFKPEA